MTTCPECNKELTEGANVCDHCGTQVGRTVFCTTCGNAISANSAFCPNCGAPVATQPVQEQPVAAAPVAEPVAAQTVAAQPVVAAPVAEPTAAPQQKKKLPKKAFLFGGIGVAVIAVLLLVVSLLPGGGSKKANRNFALYVKDKEIFFSDLKKDSEAWQLTSDLFESNIDNDDLSEISYELTYCVGMSDNGRYLFYPDKINENDDGFNLYYRVVNDPEAEPVKIDSDVWSYSVNSAGTLVTYTKGEDWDLYQYSMKDDSKEKIASEIEDYYISEDGTSIVYLNDEYSVYWIDSGKDKEKMVSEIDDSYLEKVSFDTKTIYYTKDSTLYKQVLGKDKEKIADNVCYVQRIYDSGEIYYTQLETKEYPLMDFVEDDKKESDALMAYPDYPDYPDEPDYPYSWEYDTYAERNAALELYYVLYDLWEDECDRMYDEYWDAKYEYWDKEDRDELREELDGKTVSIDTYSLCYYDGKTSTVITDKLAETWDTYYSNDAAVIVYPVLDSANVEKIKLSDIYSVYGLEYDVKDALTASSEMYVAVKSASSLLEPEEEMVSIRINDDGTAIYYVDSIPEDDNHGDLYRISIKNGTVGKPELYDSDVYGYSLRLTNNQICYYKDYSYDKGGDLYIDKKCIDYDVRSFGFNVDQKTWIYTTDWNSEKGQGTLKIYKDGEVQKIADDVHDYSLLPNGRILYLYDYSTKNYKGELREWNTGEVRKLDDDVVCIIPIYTGMYKGIW